MESPENQSGLGEPQLPPLEGEFIAADGGAQPSQQETAGMAELFQMLFVGVSSFIAGRKGEHWNATAEEAQAFGQSADKVAALYMEDSKLSPWVGLALVGLAYAGPRMAMDAMIRKQKAQQAASDEPKPGPN